MEPNFIGEHLQPGHWGHLCAILAFVAALFSAFSYWRSARIEGKDLNNAQSWLLLGRNGFVIHSVSIFGIFLALYYIIASHLFEYHYAWEHSSRALPSKYLLSCFWEGQQGSFLLWSFWHCVLGLFVMMRAKSLESRTMTVISLVQAALATFLLGFYLGPDVQIGKTPFQLLRHAMQGAPIFSQPNYLEFVKDGNGLNPLLQNYWMVIHPPVLFLGFASTLIPFAFIIAALWKGEYQSFIKPTINWTLFSGAVLGTGIMMGGAWAYESLNFGGYWAWDPVENASLVPWLTLVAGLHTLVVYKATGRSLGATVALLGITHLLVWYSTFLTRTGILGDSSVHAFTGEGSSMRWHLLTILFSLIIALFGLMIWRWKKLPRPAGEEAVLTREFWMFVGSFVLLLSATQIIISTSIPVWAPLAKWITGKDFAPPVNPIAHYNSIQVWVAVITALLSSAVLYMRFKKSDSKVVFRRWMIAAGLSLVLTLLLGWWQQIPLQQDSIPYVLLLFAGSWAVVASMHYALTVQKGVVKKMGPSFAHLGFGILLLGILFSSYNKEVISLNTLGVSLDFGKSARENARESRENVLLYKDVPVAMGNYFATYRGDSTSASDPRTFYRVDYKRLDSSSRKVEEEFTLYPDAFINPKGQQGLIANPASKHYLDHDVFTYVSSVSKPDAGDDTGSYRTLKLKAGDTAFLTKSYLVFTGFNTQVSDPRYTPQAGDVAVAATLDAYTLDGKVGTIHPVYYIRDRFENGLEDTLQRPFMTARLSKIIPEEGAAEIQVRESDSTRQFVVMKAIVFPAINLVWLGTIVMVAGFGISLWNRLTKKPKPQVLV